MKSTKHLLCLVTLVLCGYPLTSAVAAPLRTWTDVQGRTINARLLDTDSSTATIDIERTDGVCFTLPIARLSQADKEFIQHALDEEAAHPTSVEAPAEITQAQWAWLKGAGKVEAQTYVDTPISQIASEFNQSLIATQSTCAYLAIKGVRIAPLAENAKIYGEFSESMDFATFLKQLAMQNDLQLSLDSHRYIVLHVRPKTEKIEFFGIESKH